MLLLLLWYAAKKKTTLDGWARQTVVLGNRGAKPVPVAVAVVGEKHIPCQPPPGWLAYHPSASLPLPHPGLILDINTSSMRLCVSSMGTPRDALTPAIRSTVKLWFKDSPSSRCGATAPGGLSTPCPTYWSIALAVL